MLTIDSTLQDDLSINIKLGTVLLHVTNFSTNQVSPLLLVVKLNDLLKIETVTVAIPVTTSSVL